MAATEPTGPRIKGMYAPATPVSAVAPKPVTQQTPFAQTPPPPVVGPVMGGNAQVQTAPSVLPKPVVVNNPFPVTGDNAPVSTLAPNQVVYNADGSIAQVGGKNPVNSAGLITGTAQPQSPPPPATTQGHVTGGNGQQIPVTTPPAQPVQVYPESMNAGNVVQDFTNQLLDDNGAYIQNARRRGLETAANRGLLNSSIAAGASQRAAIEAAQPFVSEMVGIHQAREGRAFTGEQNQKDRDQQITMSQVQNWLNDQQFNREFNGQLALMPISSAANMNQLIQQYALDNPEVYTPDVINSMTNFFSANFYDMLKQYFPQYYGSGGT